MKGKIKLKKCEFFAYHGVSQEEQIIGNRYIVSASITFDITQAGESDNLAHTLDYGMVYEIIRKTVTEKSVKLLEYLAYQIASSIKLLDTRIHKVKVKVTKVNPPIGGVCEASEVVAKV
jgi:7,8-dihydroneopterin aldolase/epimerase/oxygenase